jgi:hypothetical protein
MPFRESLRVSLMWNFLFGFSSLSAAGNQAAWPELGTFHDDIEAASNSSRRKNFAFAISPTVLPVRSLAVIFQHLAELLDRFIDRVQGRLAMTPEIMPGMFQMELGFFKGLKRFMDFGMMFAGGFGMNGGSESQRHQQADGNNAGGEEFFHSVGIDRNGTR